MRLGIDAMGGDFAPLECIKGLQLLSYEKNDDIHLVLFGDESSINDSISKVGVLNVSYEIIHCTNNIEMSESPTRAFSSKQDSSIVKGLSYLTQNKVDAFASAGNTGAMMVGTMYTVKTIPGVLRPSLMTMIPRENNKIGLLLDVGANADCKPEMLVQFGILGSLYMEFVHNINTPKVALINIGEEEGKGNLLAQATYALLKENNQLNFIGNVEGRDIFKDTADVMICDGFTGNIILKMGESFYDIIKTRKISDSHFEQFNYENFGGSCILGVNAPVFIGHGISNANAFKNMIKTMRAVVSSNIVDKFKQAFIQSTTSIES
jgi:glycerol-3-phosphate acyltransferase PlsX